MSSLFEKLGADILASMFEVAAHGLALMDAKGRYLHINARGCAILGYSYDDLMRLNLLEHTPAEQQTLAQGWFEGSLRGNIVPQDLTVARPDGKEREVSAFCVPVYLNRERAGLIALHDVTDGRRVEREARTLARIVSSLTHKKSLYDISEAIALSVVETTESIASAVVLYGEEGYGARIAGTYGFPEGFEHETSLLAEGSPLHGRILESNESTITYNLSGVRAPAVTTDPLVSVHDWNTLVSVPLTYRDRKIGALLSYYADDYEPDSNDIDFLQALADQSVFAIENARLFFDAQDKAALEERQRLARELHDSVSQALYGIALGARSARSQLESNPQRVAERLDYVLKLAEAAITEMRALIFELRPETLATEGLVMALSKQAATLRARHHLEVEALLETEPELPLAVKEALYRIAQEALHNIVKHARATIVTLKLVPHERKVALEISDDGIGFDPNAAYPGHLGLSSMRERAELMGGSFSLESSTDGGTRLLVEMPALVKTR